MKILLLFIIIALFSVSQPTEVTSNDNTQYTVYCDGWEDGFKAGYCYEREFGCMPPLTPLCPMPRLGEETYKHGYNRGFIKGLNY